MRFHKLEMVGFKSFVDKTTVTFQRGMTAVVGPNGCGKSNIADSIRWVLGEMSAKNLRGDKMEDVIFNGSDIRKPLGMAEVNLTLQDVEGSNALGFAEFKEITITRRLYRNGDSEYMINKIPCRLKDIRDLLMDTGVGSRAYSIIEQGKIGQIVSAKAEERRYIIEEVAGITKYKSRKNEALSKLKETEDNLSRVTDIIHEVKRQIGSLDRQAKKAERYKKLSTELRGLELKMAWDSYGRLSVEAKESEEAFNTLSGEESAARNAVSAREADLSETRLRLAERERELMDFQREIHRLEAEASHLEAKAEVAVMQLKDLDDRELRMADEKKRLTQEESELSAQAMSLKEEEQALKRELDTLREELRVLEAAYQEKADRTHAVERSIEEERGRLFESQAAISQAHNRMTRLDERKAELERRAQRAAEEEGETREKLLEVKLARDKKKMELDELSSIESELRKEREAAAESMQNNKASLKELEAALSKGREIYSQKSSRLQSLKELEESLEGYGEGVKALMAVKKEGSMQGIHGVVADILQANPEHEKALEAVLGERLQHVVVEGRSDAREALAFLKSNGSGRGTFVPKSPRNADASGPDISGREGVVGAAMRLINVKSGYEPTVRALLGRVTVVRDLDAALSLWDEGCTDTLVTLDGEVVEYTGVLSGGSASGVGMLSKRREIRELTSDIEVLAEENLAAEARVTETRKELEGLEASIKRLDEEVGTKRIARVGFEKDMTALSADVERFDKKMEVLGIEKAQREQEDAEIKDGISAAKADIAEHEDRKLKEEARINELQEELKAVKAELEVEREAITVKKMDLSALIQKHESSARDIKRADMIREELGRKAARLDAEAVEINARRVELSAGKAESEEKINTLMRTVVEQKGKLPEIQNAYQVVNDSITGLEESVKAARREAEDARGALSDLELRRAEIRIKTEHLKETVDHNYHITVEEIEDDIKAMVVDPEEADMNASELRIKLERLGPVNIGAIEEYNELMERFNFLTTQKDDLESSVKSLREAIGKINKTSEELFMDAFNSINETFKQVFVSLFGGGRAELRLVTPEGGDVLDSGLEIVAQPPGKRLQSLTLFSGGEKALIAGALVFACFLVKPSPFCMLDEVDAPLDEANVERFGNMLKEFSDKTQFIVITHSRPTMELADALYGVTMDEPGVSRLVSVRLKEAADLAGV